MPDPINLRQARKAKARAEHERSGAQNRLLFGQAKATTRLTSARDDLEKRHLDNARLDKGDNT